MVIESDIYGGIIPLYSQVIVGAILYRPHNDFIAPAYFLEK